MASRMRQALAATWLPLLTACGSMAHVEVPARPITCRVGPDCDVKWSRAVAWVANNSRWKIQTQTDLLVQTYNSADGSQSPSFTVSRAASGDGLYEISLNGACDNLFGCNPTIPEARTKFAEFVGATAAPVGAAQPLPR